MVVVVAVVVVQMEVCYKARYDAWVVIAFDVEADVVVDTEAKVAQPLPMTDI